MAPISEEGVAYIQALSFIKSWGWQRMGGMWVSPVRYGYKFKDIYAAYDMAIKIVEMEGNDENPCGR